MDEKRVSQRRHSQGVRIASGANIPRTDLEALFRDRAPSDSLSGACAAVPEGAAMTGGGVQATAVSVPDKITRPNTVALTDGTQITFAAADWIKALESA